MTFRFILVMMLLLSACSQRVAKVGRFEITARDVELREQIAHLFYPSEKTPELGLIQLKQAFTLATVLEQNGSIITETILTTEAERIERDTHDRGTLQKIQKFFVRFGRRDEAEYLKVFVLPTYVDRVIAGDFFRQLPIHEESHQQALKLQDEIKSVPDQLKTIALAHHLPFEKWCLSSLGAKKMEGAPHEIQKRFEEENRLRSARWLKEIVEPTRVGQLVAPVIDYSNRWLVLRLISKKKTDACFESVSVEKPKFADWLEREKTKVVIQ